MLNQLQDHHTTLSEMLVTARYMASDELSIGLRITLTICLQILTDALSVLKSIIGHLSK